MNDFHLANIKFWKPGFVDVEHQNMWFLTALIHSAITEVSLLIPLLHATDRSSGSQKVDSL